MASLRDRTLIGIVTLALIAGVWWPQLHNAAPVRPVPHRAGAVNQGGVANSWVEGVLNGYPVAVNMQSLDGGPPASQSVTTTPAPAIAPVTYQDGGAALGTGTSWTAGPYAAVPAGAVAASWWITYTGTASTSQLGYRVNTYYGADAGSGGVERVVNSSPSISGAVATQTSYQSAVTFAETGTGKLVARVPFSVSGGVVGVSLDLLEVVQPDAGAAYWVAIAWSYQ